MVFTGVVAAVKGLPFQMLLMQGGGTSPDVLL